LAKPRLATKNPAGKLGNPMGFGPKVNYFQMLMLFLLLLLLMMMMMMIDRHFSIHIFPSNGHERMGVSGTNAYFLFGNVESSTLNFGQLSLLQNSGRTPSAWMASVASSTAPT